MNQKEYENLIRQLGEGNFNILVKEFLKEYYQTKEVHISNGPYDGGLDLVYFKDGKEVKKNIQISVQETNIEKKIYEDLEKAKENYTEYGYVKTLDFYTNKNISQSKKTKLVRDAEVEFGISLKIIDSRKLSYDADEFPSIKETIHKIYNFKNQTSIFNISKREKTLFNVLCLGDDTKKIKRHFIHAYLLTYLLEKGRRTLDKITSDLNSIYFLSLDNKKYKNELDYLKSKNQVNFSKQTQEYALTKESVEKLKEISELNETQELQLTEEIKTFLEENQLSHIATEVSKHLISLFINHFDFDVQELNSPNNSFLLSQRKIFSELASFISESGDKKKNESEKIAKELVSIASKNKFLSKIGISTMYVKLFSSDKIDKFINSTNRSIYFDTQILLRILCVQYDKTSEDSSIVAISDLLDAIKNTKLSLDQRTTDGYIEEVASHLQKALKISQFLEFPIFQKVGKSRNVFYNFYADLKKEGKIESISFRDFIGNEILGDDPPSPFDIKFISIVSRRIALIFENLGIEIQMTPFHQDFQKIKKAYELELFSNNQLRSKNAIKHDISTAFHLSDEGNHFDENIQMSLEPYLITWDFQFFNLRKVIREETKLKANWFIYPPQKFIDNINALSFEIPTANIDQTIISLIDQSSGNSKAKKAFLDVISSIFNCEDISELKLAQKFASIEEELIEQQGDQSEFDTIKTEDSILTNMLSILINYFNDPETPNSMPSFIALCQDNEKANQIERIILTNIDQAKLGYFNKEQLIRDFLALLPTENN